MKAVYSMLLVLCLGMRVFAQPTWQAVFRMDDAPFTTECDGGTALDNHRLAFVYIDADNDGPDTTDGLPSCVLIPGRGCIPEASIFTYYDFALQANGTIRSPVFRGWWNDWDWMILTDTIRVYLRVFAGPHDSLCYTSPTVTIPPTQGDTLSFDFPRAQWTCGPAEARPPDCHGNSEWIGLDWRNSAQRDETVVTCDGGRIGIGVSDYPSSFRPPVLEISLGGQDGCEPARSDSFSMGDWELMSDGEFWMTQLFGQDLGCLTVHLLDSIPTAHLDTMTAVQDGDTVELHWNTTWEDGTTGFQLWRPIPYSSAIDHHVADVPAENNPHGAQYVYRDRLAFSHGRYIAYLLATTDQYGMTYGAAYLELNSPFTAAAPKSSLPQKFALSVFPNPFNPTTTLSFSLPNAGRTKITIYNITGRTIQTLTDEVLTAGEHSLRFDGSTLPSGIYFARMQSGGFTATEKLLLLK